MILTKMSSLHKDLLDFSVLKNNTLKWNITTKSL
jgi:hypothetical protein